MPIAPRDLFPGYYPVAPADQRRLLAEGLIVLDTNVWLDLYRLPEKAREDLLNVLRGVRDRIWVPHHVAIEFQRTRLSVISSTRRDVERVLASAQKSLEEITASVESLRISERNLGLDSDKLIADMRTPTENLQVALSAVRDGMQQPDGEDELRRQIDELMTGRVGELSGGQEWVCLVDKEGESRFAARRPPGYLDEGKEKDPERQRFVVNGVEYQSKFGDLYVWKQILQRVEADVPSGLLFVTRDTKEDWMWREDGRTLGAHPELVSEVRGRGVPLVAIYSPDRFLEFGSKVTKTKLDVDSVSEIRNVGDGALGEEFDKVDEDLVWDRGQSRQDRSLMYQAVLQWLDSEGYEVHLQGSARVDFILEGRNGTIGVDLIYVDPDSFTSRFERLQLAISRGARRVLRGEFDDFLIVVVVDANPALSDSEELAVNRVARRAIALRASNPGAKAVIGVMRGKRFQPQYRLGKVGGGRDLSSGFHEQ